MMLWADGFDHYGTATTGRDNMLLGPYAANTMQPVTTQHRTGANSLGYAIGTSVRRVFGAAKQTVGVGMALFLATLPTSNIQQIIYSFRDSGNNAQITAYVDTTGAIHVYRASASTANSVSLGVSSYLLTAASWNHIEMKCSFSTTVGTVEVRVNGVTVLAVSGVNTVNSNSPGLGELSASQVSITSTPSGVSAFIDDLYAWDTTGTSNNDFMGDQKVYTDMPTADTADVAWTPSTGSTRWAVIDEIPPNSDTDYDSSSASGDRMGVTFPTLDPAIVTVASVYYTGFTKKTDAGTCNVQLICASDGTEANGVDNPITAVYTYRGDPFDVDPHTSAPWTPAKAGAAALVVKRTA